MAKLQTIDFQVVASLANLPNGDELVKQYMNDIHKQNMEGIQSEERKQIAELKDKKENHEKFCATQLQMANRHTDKACEVVSKAIGDKTKQIEMLADKLQSSSASETYESGYQVFGGLLESGDRYKIIDKNKTLNENTGNSIKEIASGSDLNALPTIMRPSLNSRYYNNMI